MEQAMTDDEKRGSAETLIWYEWHKHMQIALNLKKVGDPMISAADQMAFYEIAQPIIRDEVLAATRIEREAIVAICMAEVNRNPRDDNAKSAAQSCAYRIAAAIRARGEVG